MEMTLTSIQPTLRGESVINNYYDIVYNTLIIGIQWKFFSYNDGALINEIIL